MENHDIEAVRQVYMRACRIHLPKKPYISLAWAAFEERHGMCSLHLRFLCIIYYLYLLNTIEMYL